MADAEAAERFAGGVALKAFVGPHPLPRAWFEIDFSTTRDPVVVLIGPADERGELELNGSEIAERYQKSAELAVMDHGPWQGSAFVSVIGLAALPGLRRGYEVWGRVEGLFPPGYLEQLDRLQASLAGHVGACLHVKAAASTWLRASGPTLNRPLR